MKCTLLQGDCRVVLPTLADESVNCIVTSPPYYGLRDYGTATWEGGDSACDHRIPLTTKGGCAVGNKQSTNHGSYGYREWLTCGRCGAKRVDAQIGLEHTPESYVAELVSVFRECRRVLRGDGVFWLNIGDSYAGSTNTGEKKSIQGSPKRVGAMNDAVRPIPDGIKPKDIIGVPWRVAFALQSDGWYLRQDIIWAKPNSMPESVTDRCTKAHEYVFLLTKSERYFYDADAIMEKATETTIERCKYTRVSEKGKRGFEEGGNYVGPSHDVAHRARQIESGTRNKRSVWTIATQPCSMAHFAVMPEALVAPCILAGCPVGGTVLDPFGGSGTVGKVAEELGRNSILIELNPAYIELQEIRTAQQGLAL